MTIKQWLAEPPPADVQRALERLARTDDVRAVAVMPDVHLAREVCVGVALATTRTLIPAAVGGDIGCGMAALAFDASADVLSTARAAERVFDGLYERVPIVRHRRRSAPSMPQALTSPRLSTDALEAKKGREAHLQFGTLGRGNHFIEFQADVADERLWLMLHSGSRGMGQAIRAAHERGADADLSMIDADSDSGRAYLADVGWALTYAAENREHMLHEVRSLMYSLFRIEADETTVLSCHHNFVRREVHDGIPLWVHRKGAISARLGEAGIIPGSMGAPSFHVEGRGCAPSLCSSSHGAGRRLSRAAARRRLTARQLDTSMEGIWFDHRIANRLLEEAPAAYKDVGAVMRAQRDLTKVTRRLRPLLAFKGG